MNTSKASSQLEDDIASSIAQDMAREIDKELLDIIMIDVLTKDEGWTATKINHAFGEMAIVQEFDWYSKTAEWIHLNAQGDYKLLKGQWLFKDPKDAIMFILKWR